MHPTHHQARAKAAEEMADALWADMTIDDKRDGQRLAELLAAPDYYWRGVATQAGRPHYVPAHETRVVVVKTLARWAKPYLAALDCPECEGTGEVVVGFGCRHSGNCPCAQPMTDCYDCLEHPGEAPCQHCGERPAHLVHDSDPVCVACWLQTQEATTSTVGG